MLPSTSWLTWDQVRLPRSQFSHLQNEDSHKHGALISVLLTKCQIQISHGSLYEGGWVTEIAQIEEGPEWNQGFSLLCSQPPQTAGRSSGGLAEIMDISMFFKL